MFWMNEEGLLGNRSTRFAHFDEYTTVTIRLLIPVSMLISDGQNKTLTDERSCDFK